MVAVLARSLGSASLGVAEEAVQEAMIQALRTWPLRGVPERPDAWLYRVARNRALDHLRRERGLRATDPETVRAERELAQDAPRALFSKEISDDQLRVIFLCCHPDLPLDSRVPLTLKTVCGFSAREIARGFLTKEATIAQRLVRAQRRIREGEIPLELPPPGRLGERLDAVLEVLYLFFNEGYAAHGGDALVRSDLCTEALRLVFELARLPITDRPEVHALAALLALQASRLPARCDAAGRLVLLEDQDRSAWDRGLIGRGFHHLDRATRGDRRTSYHLQSAIAAQHAAAERPEDTDWPTILGFYDELLALDPSPIVALNRAVALARVEGPRAGLQALEGLDRHPGLARYYLLPATRGTLLADLGERAAAAEAFRTALALPASDPERRLLWQRLQAVAPATPAPSE